MSNKETQKDLEKLTRTKLIEEAKKFPDIVGAHGMNKEELVEVIRKEMAKLGEETPAAPSTPAGAKKGKTKKKPTDRAKVKADMTKLKAERREALEAKDSTALKRVRQRYKRLNRVLKRTASAK